MNSPARGLRQVFEERRAKNAAYSLRAFARDVGVSQSLVSRILGGERKLSLPIALKIADRLALEDSPRAEFLRELHPGLTHRPKLPRIAPTERFRSASFKNDPVEFRLTWLEVAMLDLVTLKNFRPDITWAAKKLGVSAREIANAYEKLFAENLLVQDGDEIRKVNPKLQFKTDRTRAYYHAYQSAMIRKSLDALESQDEHAFSQRFIAGMTSAADPARIALARERIVAFQQEIAELLNGGTPTELIQLNVQLFPLTKSDPAAG